jgi:hypothetical protein
VEDNADHGPASLSAATHGRPAVGVQGTLRSSSFGQVDWHIIIGLRGGRHVHVDRRRIGSRTSNKS